MIFFLGAGGEQKKCKIVQTMNKYVKHFSQTMNGLTEGKKHRTLCKTFWAFRAFVNKSDISFYGNINQILWTDGLKFEVCTCLLFQDHNLSGVKNITVWHLEDLERRENDSTIRSGQRGSYSGSVGGREKKSMWCIRIILGLCFEFWC